jgi:cytochrome c553
MSTTILDKVLIAAVFAAVAGVAQATEQVEQPAAVAVCATCHGEKGVSAAPIFPNLAGQHRNYIEHALQAYKSGARKNPIMAAQVAGLSDADIKQLAAWFSQQPPALYTLDPEAKTLQKE